MANGADEGRDAGATVTALRELLRHRALTGAPDARLAELIRLHTAACVADLPGPSGIVPELADLAVLPQLAVRPARAALAE